MKVAGSPWPAAPMWYNRGLCEAARPRSGAGKAASRNAVPPRANSKKEPSRENTATNCRTITYDIFASLAQLVRASDS